MSMTPEKFQRVQEYVDGLGTPAERREVEDWLHNDAEAADLRTQIELQGVLLREAVELDLAPVRNAPSLWETVGPQVLAEKPAWAKPSALPLVAEARRGGEVAETEELPLRGWVLAMMAVASLLLIISLLRPNVPEGNENEVAEAGAEQPDNGAASLPESATLPDHSLEIETMEIATSAYVDRPSETENRPTIIWVTYDANAN